MKVTTASARLAANVKVASSATPRMSPTALATKLAPTATRAPWTAEPVTVTRQVPAVAASQTTLG
jgi:hypothetical protein